MAEVRESYTIVTVGNAGSGKSSLARCMAGIELPSENKVTGVERHRLEVMVDSKPVRLEVQECPSRLLGKDYLQMIQATCKDGQAFIIVYSHGDGPPETVIMQHLHDIIHSRDPPEDKEDLPFVIVATKCDREGKDRAILTYALQKIAKKLKRPFIDTSALMEWNTYTLFEIIVRMLRIKHKGNTPLSFFKKKVKFRDYDFYEWWDWAKPTIFPPNTQATTQLPESVRAVQLHQAQHLYEYLKRTSFLLKKPSVPTSASSTQPPLSSATSRTSSQSASGTHPEVNCVLAHDTTILHLACVWGYVDCMRVLIDFGANVYAKDASGKTPLYKAAANGQLKCLPVLLERVNPFDVQNKEAMKHAFRLEVLFLYDADELCNVFRDIARTGFDLMLVAQDLEVLERQLSDGKLQPSTLGLDPKCQEQAVHQVSKALAAIRIALAEKGDGRSSGRSSNSRSSARPHADAKNPVEGYLIELAESFRTTADESQRINFAKQLQSIALGSSPSVRYQLAKQVTPAAIDMLRITTNATEALTIVKLLHTLTIDSDKATALIGSEGAIPVLLSFIASTSPSVTADLQIQSALALSSLAAGNLKNKDLISSHKGIPVLVKHVMDNANDRLMVAVMKAIRAIAENEGGAGEIVKERKFVPRLVEYVKSSKKLSVRVQALKVLSVLSSHETVLTSVITGGVTAPFLATLFTNSLKLPKLYGVTVRVLASLAKHNEWVAKAGDSVLKALSSTWPKMKNRDSAIGRMIIDVLRKFASINSSYQVYLESVDITSILDPERAKPPQKGPHAETIDKIIHSLQSTNADQAVKAANQMATLIKTEGVEVKRELLERGAFAMVWKLVQIGKLDWTGDWLPKVPVEALEIKEKIGRGAFGIVYSALFTPPGSNKKEWVAVKALEEDQLQFNDFKSELVTLSMLTGIVDNIVQFKGYCFIQQRSSGKLDQVKNFHCVVMELMDTTLERVIFAKKKLLNYKKMKKVAYEIARGMTMLHSFDIIHRDLKPANILISKKDKVWEVKIADLGYARRDTLDTIRKSVVGTPAYLAPELMDQKKSLDVTKATDVYSFGVLLWEMVTRKRALEDVDAARLPYTVLSARQQNKPLLTVAPDCDPTLKHIIESCLNYDPALRPSFEEIKSMLWQASR